MSPFYRLTEGMWLELEFEPSSNNFQDPEHFPLLYMVSLISSGTQKPKDQMPTGTYETAPRPAPHRAPSPQRQSDPPPGLKVQPEAHPLLPVTREHACGERGNCEGVANPAREPCGRG